MIFVNNMNIISKNYNLSFGIRVPTKSLLKCSLPNQFSYENSRNLCLAIENRFPGNMGYYRKSVYYINQIEAKNPEIKVVLDNLRALKNSKSQNLFINDYIAKNGQTIDVKI